MSIFDWYMEGMWFDGMYKDLFSAQRSEVSRNYQYTSEYDPFDPIFVLGWGGIFMWPEMYALSEPPGGNTSWY